MQIMAAPDPRQVSILLKRLPEWTPLPGRPFDEVPVTGKRRYRAGNRHETVWAVRGELLGCIEKLPPRQRDAVITCTIKGESTAIIEKRWGVCRTTVYRDQRNAWRAIAHMLGWRAENELTAPNAAD